MLAEQLDAVGALVSEEDHLITLLTRLIESYEFLITALDSVADSLSWDFVTYRLLQEDLKRKEQGFEGETDGQSQAFINQNIG
uniref:Uncharacterized protein n=1 Tax=Peronospora matthiolae TaxID=2874970 RepID=A0AAV1V1A1_9STRA